jgi:hypothetical protein
MTQRITPNQQIWNELVCTDYQFDTIIIDITGHKFITIIIVFFNDNDLVEFIEYIGMKKNLFPNGIHNNCMIVTLLVDLNEDYFNVFSKIPFPPNTWNIKIMAKLDKNFNKLNKIGSLNLPENLKTLKITSDYPFDLSNLPGGLVYLDLTDTTVKITLDNLPESLCGLDLPGDKIYIPNDLVNLPVGLKVIKIGYKTYNSIRDITKHI